MTAPAPGAHTVHDAPDAPRDAVPCAVPGTPLAAAVPGIMSCVHCGFCLQACPTYLALGDENDSPRGRIFLARALVEGDLSLDDAAPATHFDRCLGCRACETACPSGVPYGEILEAARATLVTRHPMPVLARILLRVFAHPTLLAPSLAVARALRRTGVARLLARLPGRVGFGFAMLAASESPLPRRRWAPDGDGSRGAVALLRGCVMEGLFADTNRATERTLAANAYAVVAAPGQQCCGALHAHAGDLDGARALARINVAAFERANAEWIAVNASGCGAMMKEYGHLLAGDSQFATRAADVARRVRDVTELLAAAGPVPAGPLPLRVTYDAPCHLVHAQRVMRPPLAVLEAIPELQLEPLVDADQCCGSAGIYNLVQPAIAQQVLAPKLAHIEHTRASLVATGNPGCLMQIGAGLLRRGSATRVVHPVDLLDAAYAARSRPWRTRRGAS